MQAFNQNDNCNRVKAMESLHMLMLARLSVRVTTVATENSNRVSVNYGAVYLEKYYIRYNDSCAWENIQCTAVLTLC